MADNDFEMGAEAYTRAEARKARSIAILKAEGVPFIDWLPLTAENGQRSPREVVGRYCALMLVSFKGSSCDHEQSGAIRKGMGIHVHLSPRENAFLDNPNPSMRDRVQFSWAAEAAIPLAWAMGWIDELYRPDNHADTQDYARLAYDNGVVRVADAKALRPLDELLDACDLTYRYHWAVRQASLDGKDPPAGLHGGVVMERHRALNWLVQDIDLDWDDVSTDT